MKVVVRIRSTTSTEDVIIEVQVKDHKEIDLLSTALHLALDTEMKVDDIRKRV